MTSPAASNHADRIISEIMRDGVVHTADGNERPLHSAIDADEGAFLRQIVAANPYIRRTAEIGCAYGISSLFLCAALSGRDGARHVIVDPNQNTQWEGIGVANLERAGIDFFTLIEQGSELALPALVADGERFDLIFIDGWHTFDHTLVDLFYANQLLNVGGYIVIDDCRMAPVARAVSYVMNYPAFELAGIGAESSQSSHTGLKRLANLTRRVLPPAVAMRVLPKVLYDRFYVRAIYGNAVALRKIAPDDRSWDWYCDF